MKLRRLFGFGLFGMLLLSALAYGEEQEKINLSLRLASGQLVVQKIEKAFNIVQEFPGNRYEVSESVRYTVVQEVMKVEEDGNANVRCTFRSVAYKRISPNGVIDYDSGNRSESIPPEATGFALLTGTSINIRLSAKGAIIQVIGAEELQDQQLKRFPVDGPARRSIRRVFSQAYIREMLEQTAGLYPDTPVGVDDIWTETDIYPRYFPIVVDSYFKLQERKDGLALIAVKSGIRSEPEAKPVKAGSMLLRYDLIGQMVGMVKINEKTGLITQADLKEDFSGIVLADGVPGSASRMSWPISISSSVRVEDIGLSS